MNHLSTIWQIANCWWTCWKIKRQVGFWRCTNIRHDDEAKIVKNDLMIGKRCSPGTKIPLTFDTSFLRVEMETREIGSTYLWFVSKTRHHSTEILSIIFGFKIENNKLHSFSPSNYFLWEIFFVLVHNIVCYSIC